MTAKDKAALMRKMRARRERDGWVQINVWVKPEWIAKVRAYVARLTRASDNQSPGHKP